jgi:hypothetical protein
MRESTAILWTLLLGTLAYVVKVLVFVKMRFRMGSTKGMTVFGTALADLITSLALLAIVFSFVLGSSYWYARKADVTACRVHRDGSIDPIACLEALRHSAMPDWMTLAHRSLIASLATLTIGTGLVVLLEMSRRASGLVVRQPPPEDRVVYQGPERRKSIRRRDER